MFTARIEGEQAWLFLPGDTVTLQQAPAESGATYSNDKLTFWLKGDEAWLKVDDIIKHDCRNNRALVIWERPS